MNVMRHIVSKEKWWIILITPSVIFYWNCTNHRSRGLIVDSSWTHRSRWNFELNALTFYCKMYLHESWLFHRQFCQINFKINSWYKYFVIYIQEIKVFDEIRGLPRAVPQAFCPLIGLLISPETSYSDASAIYNFALFKFKIIK